jgi:hypothetical protein
VLNTERYNMKHGTNICNKVMPSRVSVLELLNVAFKINQVSLRR